MTILGITYQFYYLSLKIFDREIRLRCLLATVRRNEKRKIHASLELQKMMKKEDKERQDEIRRDRDLRAKASGITI